jgi:hypothetical protein
MATAPKLVPYPEHTDPRALVAREPTEARAALPADLIDGIDEPDEASEDVEAAWGEEIRQRLADVDAGVVTPIPWLEARRRIFAAAQGRREAT